MHRKGGTGVEQLCNIPVEILTVCGTDGRLQPIRFRLEDEAHQLHTVSVGQVISVKEVQYVGIEALVYLCKAEFRGRERLFELRYTVSTHRWVLLRMVY